MFGRLMIEPVVQVDPRMDLQTAVATLVKVTEDVEIVRWIELSASVLLFLLVPGDPDSGAVYVLVPVASLGCLLWTYTSQLLRTPNRT